MKNCNKFLLITIFLLLFGLNQIYSQGSCEDSSLIITVESKSINYNDLPGDLKNFMNRISCDVTSRSVYNYGSVIDLNSDGEYEYAFCCQEKAHGPCYMIVFGKVSGKWKVLCGLAGYLKEDNYPGFSVLKTITEGYYNICQDGRVFQFSKGKYVIRE